MFAFPKTARLLLRKEFREVLDHGIKIADHNLVMVARPASETTARLGIIVSKKVGGAVVRNRIKRLLRERYRASRASLGAINLVIIARHKVAETPSEELFGSYDRCVSRLVRKLEA